MSTPQISQSLVSDLIRDQFPHWAHLPIRPVAFSGWDNRMFRLGDDKLIRLPSAEQYALQVQKEQHWLPILGSHISVTVPTPLALGHPSQKYPWHWSVYQWIEGESANTLSFRPSELKLIALHLAQFLHELHRINPSGGPVAGVHNFYRGGALSIYDAETRAAILQLKNRFNPDRLTQIWEKALSSEWTKNPVWLHGDLSAGNILITDHKLTAVIDFGCMGIGDPACDLVIAWTFFNGESREFFKSQLSLDKDTWNRARGWALWKSLITLVALKDKTCNETLQHQNIITDILNEHTM